MKQPGPIRPFRAVLLAAAAVASCSQDALAPGGVTVQGIVLEPATATIGVGAAMEMSATLVDGSGEVIADRSVHWAVEDPTVVSVSGGGVVTGQGIGTTQVAASAGGKSAVAQITVVPTAVASVHVSPGNMTLFIGQSRQLNGEARDASGNVLDDRPLTWSSNNPNVASVSGSGVVTARTPGGAIITARSEGKTALASVTVSLIPVSAVLVKPSSQDLVVGQSAQLQAEPVDSLGDPLPGRVVSWSTSDPGTATVTSSGVVMAIAAGAAIIVATCEGRADSATVDVRPRPANAVIVSPAQVQVIVGATAQLTATVLNQQGQPLGGRVVTWSSSDVNTATVSSDGIVTGVAVGNALVTATSQGISGSAQVTVQPVPVDSVDITPSSPTIVVGQTVTLSVAVLDAVGGILPNRVVTWTSGTPSVASVSSSGVVTGKSSGTAVIFGTAGGVAGSVAVTVRPVPVSTVTVAPASATLTVGDSLQLSATARDASGSALSGRVVGWSSADVAIATVSSSGLVTALSPGSAIVAAASEGQSGMATVTVAAAAVRTVTVTPATMTLGLLDSGQLTAVVRSPTGQVQPNAKVAWTSNRAAVASVGNDGLVRSFLPGTATITAQSGSASGTAIVTVKLGG